MKEPVLAWVARLGDVGVDGIWVTVVDPGILSNIITHLYVMQRLLNLGPCERNKSLMYWLIKAIRNTCWFLSEMAINNRGWRTTDKLQKLLKGLGIKGAVFETLFTGPDRAMFIEVQKKMLPQQGPRSHHGDLVCFPVPFRGTRSLISRNGFVDLTHLIQPVRRVCKLATQRRWEKKASGERVLSGLLKDKWGCIWVEVEFLRKMLI